MIHLLLVKKTDLANLESDVDKLDIDKVKNLPTHLSNFKSKVNKLDVDKLVPVPFDLGKLGKLVKSDVVKIDVYNAKINEVEGEIPSVTNLATKVSLTTVENKITSVSNLGKKLTIAQKLMKFKRKLLIIIMINILLLQNSIS